MLSLITVLAVALMAFLPTPVSFRKDRTAIATSRLMSWILFVRIFELDIDEIGGRYGTPDAAA